MGNVYAMRIWLKPDQMVAYGVTAADISNALASNNVQAQAGKTEGSLVSIAINPKMGLQSVEGFKKLVVKSNGNEIVRLGDVANVELGSESYDISLFDDAKPAVFIPIYLNPEANPLSVVNNIYQLFPDIKKNLPPSIEFSVAFDSTKFIRASIHEVVETIFITTAVVILVILLFLGSLRTLLMPAVAIPLSLIGVCSFMLVMGYSINTLTLLAMVLAIGMVVDDAIVVVENIYRHIEEGLDPYKAAIIGAREIAFPVIAMSITLAAVYAPIGLMQGLTGKLFTEFAFTLAGSVVISAVIALTLSPMLCSRVLSKNLMQDRFVVFVDRFFNRLKDMYTRRLTATLKFRPVTIVFSIIILLSCIPLYLLSGSELAPQEDSGFLMMSAFAPEYANLNYLQTFTKEYEKIASKTPGVAEYFSINGYPNKNQALGGMKLKPWGDRKWVRHSNTTNGYAKVETTLQGCKLLSVSRRHFQARAGPFPIQFEVTTIGNYKNLFKYSQQITEAAQKSGYFAFIKNSLLYNKPQVNLEINRDKAAALGITMQEIAQTLSATLSGSYVNYFSRFGNNYQVIPQLDRASRLNPKQLDQVYVRAASGKMIPLSALVTLKQSVEPNTLTRFQQFNSTELDAIVMPGITMGKALNFLIDESNKILPQGFGYDYGGQLRQYVQESGKLLATFFFALLIIYLVLAAQFESFRDPFTILFSVPMSICGALIPLALGWATLNIYTEIGLVTLIGLISKHGILMVEFANKLRDKSDISILDAIIEAASVRLRPVLMTTFAMILGVVPLILATGAGSVSRFDIGLVIAFGMAIGTLFTLFVVPAVYTYFAKKERGGLHQEIIDIE